MALDDHVKFCLARARSSEVMRMTGVNDIKWCVASESSRGVRARCARLLRARARTGDCTQ